MTKALRGNKKARNEITLDHASRLFCGEVASRMVLKGKSRLLYNHAEKTILCSKYYINSKYNVTSLGVNVPCQRPVKVCVSNELKKHPSTL